MADLDHVFSRFRSRHTPSHQRHEVMSVRRKGGLSSTRVVEVVHRRSGAAPSRNDPPPPEKDIRPEPPTPIPAPFPAAAKIEKPQPTVHVMPMWEPSQANTDSVEAPRPAPARRGRPRRQPLAAPTLKTADPFDLEDEGTNCLRCGYLVEAAREKRGLMTCARCG